MVQEPSVSISEASRILGVSEAALRQWTDEGKIRAFITPGGHRRYFGAELKKFMSSHSKMLGIKDLAVELEGTVQLHRKIGRSSLSADQWYDKLSPETQEHLAEVGRRLLNLIIKYLTEPAKREETVKLARQVGLDHGETLARIGLPLTDSVEAFILHREPIMKAVADLMKRKEAFTGRVAEAIPLVAHIMDEVLVSLVTAHQQHRSPSQGERRGEPSR